MYPTLSHLIKDLTGVWIPLPIATFGLFVALAFLISAWFLKLELKRKENEGLIYAFSNRKGVLTHPYQAIGNIVFVAAIFGIIGARIFSILEYPEDFVADPLGTLFSFRGLTFYGGLILGSIAVIIYTRKLGFPTLDLADAVAPSLMLAYAIGRIGCQMSGDGDWGIDNPNPKPGFLSWLPDWAWAFNYPHNVANQGVPIPGCTGEYCNVLATPVFPTPLYEIVVCTMLFGLLWLLRKRIKVAGVLFALYLILNGIERFFIEKIRVDVDYNIFGYAIKQAEIISVLLILTGIGLIIFFRSKHKSAST